MREYDADQEQVFSDKIDRCFPYNEAEAATLLIEEASHISLNASFCVLHEICSPPHPSPTTRARQRALIDQWAQKIDHPLAEAVLPCAMARLEGRELPSAVAIPILSKVGQFDRQLAALTVVLSATDDSAQAVRSVERELRARWAR
jgi:hypothetical protein